MQRLSCPNFSFFSLIFKDFFFSLPPFSSKIELLALPFSNNTENLRYTQTTSKIGFSAAPKHRNLPILSDLIFLILGHLKSTNSESFRVAQNQFLKLFEYNSFLRITKINPELRLSYICFRLLHKGLPQKCR
jgi:hypothetical protein